MTMMYSHTTDDKNRMKQGDICVRIPGFTEDRGMQAAERGMFFLLEIGRAHV